MAGQRNHLAAPGRKIPLRPTRLVDFRKVILKVNGPDDVKRGRNTCEEQSWVIDVNFVSIQTTPPIAHLTTSLWARKTLSTQTQMKQTSGLA